MHLFLILAVAMLIASALPAAVSAHAPEPYHTVVQAGPYAVEVGFSEWPVLAERSVDVTFMPAGGIADKTATLAFSSPDGDGFARPLGRHPRQRDFWGLDLIAFPVSGDWSLRLAVDGPQGAGAATIGPFTVGPRPGPPPLPMYLIGLAPAIGLIGLIVLGWRRVQPARTADAAGWA